MNRKVKGASNKNSEEKKKGDVDVNNQLLKPYYLASQARV